MRIAPRLTSITGDGSDGWDVFYRARAMAAAGEKVIELTIGEHDDRTARKIIDRMAKSARDGNTGYALMPGQNSLREAVARRVTERTGVETALENVLITPGGQSALFAAHMAACDEGDRALFIDPYYATYPGTIRAVGARAVPVEARAEDEFQPDAEEISRDAPGARSLLINSPNNPTGVVYSAYTMNRLAQVTREFDMWMISDEVYDTQVWEGHHITPRALPGMADRTLVVGSMSKSHAMTGFRCGWLIGPEAVIARLISLVTVTTYSVPGFVQDAALFALNQGPDFEAEIAAPFRRRREIAARVLGGGNVLRIIPSAGAMYLMLDVRGTGMTGEGFANRLLDETRIAVMPGESFGRAAAGHVRIAMTIDDDRFEQALGTIADFAQGSA